MSDYFEKLLFAQLDEPWLADGRPASLNPAFGKNDLHIRINGMMDGKEGRPLRPASDFVREIAALTTRRQLASFLRDPTNAKEIYNRGKVAKGLWRSADGQHTIKKVRARDGGYMPYAQIALLNPQLRLMPRIDAIIEARHHVYIVMETLSEEYELPAAERRKYKDIDEVRRCSTVTERERRQCDRNFGVDKIGGHVYPQIGLYVIGDMPRDFNAWRSCVRELIGVTRATFDLGHSNFMFRCEGGGFVPVIIDPFLNGHAYSKLSPRYRDGRREGREFVWDIGNPKQRPAWRHKLDLLMRRFGF